MVCTKCETKLNKLSTPGIRFKQTSKLKAEDEKKEQTKQEEEKQEMIKDDANKLLSKKRAENRFEPLGAKCRICKVAKLLAGHYYCQHCSYKKGICSMCGKKIIDVREFKQMNK